MAQFPKGFKEIRPGSGALVEEFTQPHIGEQALGLFGRAAQRVGGGLQQMAEEPEVIGEAVSDPLFVGSTLGGVASTMMGAGPLPGVAVGGAFGGAVKAIGERRGRVPLGELAEKVVGGASEQVLAEAAGGKVAHALKTPIRVVEEAFRGLLRRLPGVPEILRKPAMQNLKEFELTYITGDSPETKALWKAAEDAFPDDMRIYLVKTREFLENERNAELISLAPAKAKKAIKKLISDEGITLRKLDTQRAVLGATIGNMPESGRPALSALEGFYKELYDDLRLIAERVGPEGESAKKLLTAIDATAKDKSYAKIAQLFHDTTREVEEMGDLLTFNAANLLHKFRELRPSLKGITDSELDMWERKLIEYNTLPKVTKGFAGEASMQARSVLRGTVVGGVAGATAGAFDVIPGGKALGASVGAAAGLVAVSLPELMRDVIMSPGGERVVKYLLQAPPPGLSRPSILGAALRATIIAGEEKKPRPQSGKSIFPEGFRELK